MSFRIHRALAAVALLALSACSEDPVPQRFLDAALESCRHDQMCDPERFQQYYASVEACVEFDAKYIDWSDRSDACIDAEVDWHLCWAQQPCKGTAYDPCKQKKNLISYQCNRYDTATFGMICVDDVNECSKACSGYLGYLEALCTPETPEYCSCGGEVCAQGQICCYCKPGV